MKILRNILLYVSALLLPSAAFAQDNNIIDEIIWIVGDDPILKSEVEEQRLASEVNGEQVEVVLFPSKWLYRNSFFIRR